MKSNRIIAFLVVFVLYCMSNCFVHGNEAAINVKNIGHGGTHFGIPFIPADQPSVYYDEDDQEIIIVGPGYATYYDVDIVSVSTGLMVYYDTIGGMGDTIDISSLPADDYIITITSSNNNVFEGQFCIEE